ncbi:hypothetical protein G6F61_006490 [Rhizopus arrhizus]|nr:hypothetical protein G6F61_006490 [Rhizopus arrhizus]
MIPSAVLRSPELVQKVLKSFHTAGGYDALVLPGLKLVKTESGKISAEFQVEKQHLNRLGSVHGGLLATTSVILQSTGFYSLDMIGNKSPTEDRDSLSLQNGARHHLEWTLAKTFHFCRPLDSHSWEISKSSLAA